MHCPKCQSKNKVKSGIVRGKQRYKCKSCHCNFTQSSSFRIPLEVRLRCIKLYIEGVGFRGIERLEKVSHVAVMKWVRQLGKKINENKETKREKVSIVELDELWHFVGKKKQKCWVWAAYDRDRGRGLAFYLGSRNQKSCEGLFKQLSRFDIQYYCTDGFKAYHSVIPREKHIATKSETCAIESFNSRIRHYLARFHRKTFCYSKAIHMIYATLTIFISKLGVYPVIDFSFLKPYHRS